MAPAVSQEDRLCGSAADHGFGVFEFGDSSPVAVVFDQAAGFGQVGWRSGVPRVLAGFCGGIEFPTSAFTLQPSKQSGSGEEDVGVVERHGASAGDSVRWSRAMLRSERLG